jgi:hypothetical protein
MVVGVSTGFRRTLEIEGVGYQADVQGKNISLKVGLSHPVIITPPDSDTSFEVPKTAVDVLSTSTASTMKLSDKLHRKFALGDPPNPIWARVSVTRTSASVAKPVKRVRNKDGAKCLMYIAKQKMMHVAAVNAAFVQKFTGQPNVHV